VVCATVYGGQKIAFHGVFRFLLAMITCLGSTCIVILVGLTRIGFFPPLSTPQ